MTQPPRFLEALIAWVLPKPDRDLLIADLGELYRHRAARDGGWPARWWYVRQTVSTWLRLLRPANRRAIAPGTRPPHPRSPRERNLMESIWQDVRFALRTLVRSPLYATVVVLTLAVGVGINATIFTLINAVLFRPLPVQDPHELVEIYSLDPQIDTPVTSSSPDFADIAASATTLSGLAGHSAFTANLRIDDRSEFLFGEFATGGFFELIGLQPVIGRLIGPEDDRVPGGHAVVVLGHAFWQDRFGGDPAALGESLTLNGRPYTVIGVAPPTFTGLTPALQAELWLPAMMAAVVPPVGIQSVEPSPGDTRVERRGTRWMSMKGRRADGVSVQQVRAELDAIYARLGEQYPDTNADWEPRVMPADSVRFHPMVDGFLGPASAVILGMVGLVLLSACTNIAAMTLSRASTRGREVAVRLALGAGRLRLVRQLLTESLLLAALGGLGGVLLAYALRGLLLQFRPSTQLPLSWSLPMDWRVVGFTFGLALLAGVVFGLAPALRSSRTELVDALKDGARTTAGSGRRLGLRGGLVVVQVAVCVVLLVGAALLIRSSQAASQVDVGFAPERLVTLQVDTRLHNYTTDEATAFFDSARRQLPALPGVQSVTFASRLPLSLGININGIYIEGHQLTPDDPSYQVDATSVDGRYFETLGVSLLRGRAFGPQDTRDSPDVAIVSRALAERYFPDGAVGQRFHIEGLTGPAYEIVGVAENTKVRTVGEDPRPYVYYAREQQSPLTAEIVVRVDRDTPEQRAALRETLTSLEPELVLLQDSDMQTQVRDALTPVRLGAAMLVLSGLLALGLVSVGLYGVIAYSVAQRQREIGVRMAVGAARRDVLALVLRSGLGLVAIGAALGCIGAAILGQTLSAVLYGVGALDPVAFGVAMLVLLSVAALANWLPARRAARLDPVGALRTD